jgi:hypothetical protein
VPLPKFVGVTVATPAFLFKKILYCPVDVPSLRVAAIAPLLLKMISVSESFTVALSVSIV